MKKILASIIVGALPVMSFAQAVTANTAPASNGLLGLVLLLGTWVSAILPLIISLGVVWFIWNVFRYAIAGNEDDKAIAKQQMIWGLFGIFVMVSVWGLVAILQATLFGNQVTGYGAGQIDKSIKDLTAPF